MWLLQSSILDRLNDIVTPLPVEWAPQTVGWWILAGIGIALGGWAAFSAERRRKANRYRVAALAELDRIEALTQDPAKRLEGLRALPALVKRTALAVMPREDVAPLTGDSLLTFLDATYPGTAFSNGAGPLLVEAPYWSDERLSQVEGEQADATMSAVRAWIRTHRAEAPHV